MIAALPLSVSAAGEYVPGNPRWSGYQNQVQWGRPAGAASGDSFEYEAQLLLGDDVVESKAVEIDTYLFFTNDVVTRPQEEYTIRVRARWIMIVGDPDGQYMSMVLRDIPKLMDEPTSGLDPLIQKEFFSLIRERQQEGATIFLSSHVLSEIQQNCTRAAVVKEGRLVAVEPVSRLLKTNSRLVTLQGPCTLPEIPEISSVQHSGDTVRFLYQGQAQSLLQLLGQMPVEDVTITEPDLEDVFLHYYEKGGESQ